MKRKRLWKAGLKTQAGKTTGAHISSFNNRSAIYRRPGLPGQPAQELRERQLRAAGLGAQVAFRVKAHARRGVADLARARPPNRQRDCLIGFWHLALGMDWLSSGVSLSAEFGTLLPEQTSGCVVADKQKKRSISIAQVYGKSRNYFGYCSADRAWQPHLCATPRSGVSGAITDLDPTDLGTTLKKCFRCYLKVLDGLSPSAFRRSSQKRTWFL